MDGHQEALERTIAAGTGVLTEKHAALVALCRDLAQQMDATTPDIGPTTRLSAAYLSALKDLGRALAVKGDTRNRGKLAELRSVHGSQERRRTAAARRIAER